MKAARLIWASERHLRVSLADGEEVRAAVERLANARGVVDVAAGFATVVIELEAGADVAEVEGRVRGLVGGAGGTDEEKPGRGRPGSLVEIPVCFEGECGPDLEDVARVCGETVAEVIEAHLGAEYVARFVGFQPGFAYLEGGVLDVPRLERPRTRVPAGSVGLAGRMSGVYPFASPGGWRLIGRTPERMFDAGRGGSGGKAALVEIGDRVRFVRIGWERFVEMQREASAQLRSRDVGLAGAGVDGTLSIVDAGMMTTVQDLGRPGFAAVGVVRGGAADALSLRVGNWLVGNEVGAAGLEMTLVGAEVEFERDAVVAMTGGDVEAVMNGKSVPMWRAVRVVRGQRLRIGRVKRGARLYLCVAGGVNVPVALGGRGTHLGAGFGGFEGRALRAGDRIALGRAVGEARAMAEREVAATRERIFRREIRVVPGAQFAEFTEAGKLLESEYRVLAQSDRVGVRLEGEALKPPRAGRMESEGMMWGAVQVPEDGRPIVLGVDHPTTGGYPVVACVVEEDLPVVGQLAPGGGERVRFRMVSLEEARAARREWERWLERVGEAT